MSPASRERSSKSRIPTASSESASPLARRCRRDQPVPGSESDRRESVRPGRLRTPVPAVDARAPHDHGSLVTARLHRHRDRLVGPRRQARRQAALQPAGRTRAARRSVHRVFLLPGRVRADAAGGRRLLRPDDRVARRARARGEGRGPGPRDRCGDGARDPSGRRRRDPDPAGRQHGVDHRSGPARASPLRGVQHPLHRGAGGDSRGDGAHPGDDHDRLLGARGGSERGGPPGRTRRVRGAVRHVRRHPPDAEFHGGVRGVRSECLVQEPGCRCGDGRTAARDRCGRFGDPAEPDAVALARRRSPRRRTLRTEGRRGAATRWSGPRNHARSGRARALRGAVRE